MWGRSTPARQRPGPGPAHIRLSVRAAPPAQTDRPILCLRRGRPTSGSAPFRPAHTRSIGSSALAASCPRRRLQPSRARFFQSCASNQRISATSQGRTDVRHGSDPHLGAGLVEPTSWSDFEQGFSRILFGRNGRLAKRRAAAEPHRAGPLSFAGRPPSQVTQSLAGVTGQPDIRDSTAR